MPRLSPDFDRRLAAALVEARQAEPRPADSAWPPASLSPARRWLLRLYALGALFVCLHVAAQFDPAAIELPPLWFVAAAIAIISLSPLWLLRRFGWRLDVVLRALE